MNLKAIKNKIFNGKNPKFIYYIRAYVMTHIPRALLRPALSKLDSIMEQRADRDYILDRVNYYCKNSSYPEVDPKKWAEASVNVGNQPMTRQKVYYNDAMEYARHFDPSYRWCLISGDVNYTPTLPSIVKSRPIGGDNHNAVLLKLDKVRHFIFTNDKMPWRNKTDRAIFRGKIAGKEQRLEFMHRWFGNPRIDAGVIDKDMKEWTKPKLTIPEHRPYRYIMSIEGNDVASNLKWVMSSNSIAVMPRPLFETWFMEGRLIPNYHYIEVKPDFSDLLERMDYYSAHPEEAEAIIKHAHEYVDQFRNSRRERLISLLVLKKYFMGVGQIK